ncbi:MAG: YkgJ family cysteine cluster protein [Pseudobdellovibrionaceae bacterium]|nr:YkgJ family cysteine cluster protein [Bdellovibrionales bacterium]USN47158.1 MAG: YkgJ family cysteine cluster protein [Pseudobdellovibrionaceae bacterium]
MDKWYKEGVRFECQGSGKCCASRGAYGYVYLTLSDRRRMAKELNLPTSTFTRQYCEKTDGYYHLKSSDKQKDCMFLNGARCEIYHGRPVQCRTWPFWPENMSAKAWNKDVASFCPGIGKGRKYSANEIESIMKEQEKAEALY